MNCPFCTIVTKDTHRILSETKYSFVTLSDPRPFIPDNRFKVSHLHIHVRPRTLGDELYAKVQIFEKDVFKKVTEEEWEKYKELFKD